MKLSRKTIYAIMLLVAIAKKGDGEYVTIKEVAKTEGISVKYLEQIGTALCKAGLIKSWRGPNGGYHLARTPKAYTLSEIILLMEGKISSDYIESINSLSVFWDGLCRTLNDYLNKTTLYDLIEDEKALAGVYDYCI
ncbi:MAG: Rrf2 family transcriptional regulator [Firmicutes bacterium]|nr:Rrf2 family transcriptional regulator [Bacillota bacterium]MBQ9518316.1 Rrf2 family transcriptional regulator [Bacillota bacterium]